MNKSLNVKFPNEKPLSMKQFELCF